MNMKTLMIVLILTLVPTWALAADGYWGFGIRVEAGGFFLNPKIESATVRQLLPGSEAAEKGVADGDRITRVGDCEIPGCRGKLARKMIDVDPGVTRRFDLVRPDGSTYSVTLTAIEWPDDD